MGVYVCLLAADVQALALRSSAVVGAHSQLKKSANTTLRVQPTTAQVERPLEQTNSQSIRLSSQYEKIVAASPVPRALFCALLSKYLSLS
jgi:hypothetical protein